MAATMSSRSSKTSKSTACAKIVLAAALTLGTSGCASLEAAVNGWNKAEPEATSTSMTAALACLGREVSSAIKGGRKFPKFLLVVADVRDETRSPQDPYTGKLSFGGAKVLENAFDSNLPRQLITVPLKPPAALNGYLRSNSDLSKEQILALEDFRKLHGADFVLILEAGFTKFDETLRTDGDSKSAVYEGKTYSGGLSFGDSAKVGRIGLHGKIGSPIGNIRMHSVALDIATTSNSNRYMLNLGYRGAGIGLERERLMVDGPHGAQQVLLEAAAYQVVSHLVEGFAHEKCLNQQTASREANTLWQELPRNEQIKQIQAELERRGYYRGAIDGKWGPAMQSAVNKFATERKTLPFGPDNLMALHFALQQAGVMAGSPPQS